jgi:hypothetical protein
MDGEVAAERTKTLNRRCDGCFAFPGGGRAEACTKLAARELSEIKSTISTFASGPGGLFVSCVIGKAYPDAFSGADDRRLKAIRDARIRATSACFPQIEATRG